ncbi:MAG: putative oxidoreductase, partial [Gammaproteobacteria bacterium]
MQKTELAVRYLLVLMLLVFGLNKFLHFMPQPEAPEEGGKFLGALFGAGYVFPTIGIVFLASAVLLVGKRVVLALLLLAPIAVNILGYHLKFDVAGIGGGAVLTALMAILTVIHVRS